jgi:hypothetical protein
VTEIRGSKGGRALQSFVMALALFTYCAPSSDNDTRALAQESPQPKALAGRSSTVPPGFEPIRVQNETEEGFDVRLQGRSLHFEHGPFPRQIRSLDQNLFLSPPRIVLGQGGNTIPIVWGERNVSDTSDRRTVFTTQGSAGSLSVEASTTIEFDGMIRVGFRVTSESPSKFDRFAYTFDFEKDAATHFNHHLKYDYRTMRVVNKDLLDTAGAIPDTPLRIDHVPSFAVGGDDVGFEWWADTDADWAPGSDGGINLSQETHGVRLTIAPVGRATRVGPDRSWTHELAIFALPMRTAPSVVHGNRFIPLGEASRYTPEPWLRMFSIQFPGQFQSEWHGLPASIDDDRQVALRARFARLGVGYIPYAKLTAAPSLHPHAMARSDEWSATGKMFTGPGGSDRKFLAQRGWKRRTPYSYAACAWKTDYLDWILGEVLRALDAEALDGLYFDWGAVMEPCADSSRRGAIRWGYFQVRDFYRRLYEAVRARNPTAPITIHTHGQPRALGAFVDYVFVGEALSVVFRDGRPMASIMKDRKTYKPHYMSLPPGFLDALMSPRSGGTTSLLPEVKFARDPDDPEREAALTRELFAVTLLNGYPMWLVNSDPAARVRIIQAVDRFGNLDEARLIPWRTDPLGVGSSDLRASAYVADGRALLIVTNWTDRTLRATLRPDADQLGIRRIARMRDPEERRGRDQPVPRDGIGITVPPRDLRLVLLE